jgi:ankyrin repeat protein
VSLILLICSVPAICAPIHGAAKTGDPAKVKALLNANPKLVSSKDNNDFESLYAAAGKGYKKVVELLLAHGAEVKAQTNEGFAPLFVEAGGREGR